MQRHINYWVTNKCNLLCKHCLRGKQTSIKDLPLSVFSNTLLQAKNLGVCSIGFTGGEPCLCSQFEEMIEIIAQHNMAYSIATNGTLLDMYAKVYEKNPNLQVLKIGLDGFKNEHNEIRNKEVYNDVINFIKYFKDKTQIVLAYCINKINYQDIFKFAKFSLDFLKVNHLEIFYLITCDYNQHLVLNDPERKIARGQLQAVHQLKGINLVSYIPLNLFIEHNTVCDSLKSNNYVLDQNGNLMLCCNCPDNGLPISNVIDNGWKKSEKLLLDFRAGLIENLKHKTKKLKYRCDYCIEYYMEHYNETKNVNR